MVARKFLVRHNDSSFDVDYDTDDGFEVLKFQLFSLTSVPPEDQKIFGGDGDRLLFDDADLVSISDKLRLVSVSEDASGEGKISNQDAESLKSDEQFARMLQAEEEALLLQQYIAGEDTGQMEQRLRPYVDQVLMYDDPTRQEAARKTVPVDDLEEKALVSLAKEGIFKPLAQQKDHAFLLQLLFWFKQSFRWMNTPDCEGCGNETISQGMGVALPSELRFGGSRVELYCCKSCSRITRFPRYNDPLKLVETRSGRCGEWANCFTLYCRAFGYDSRLVLDFTDHVWTECFSHFLGRWMHLDPCEGVYDKPLLYEKGWNKKLNYVIAFAKDGVYDVTKRYTKNWPEVLSRRTIITEPALTALLSDMTKQCRKNFTSQTLSTLENCDRNEAEDLEGSAHSKDDESISLPGRQSGDKTWRILRQEVGSDGDFSVGCSSCAVRTCIDEHVTRIYNSFYPVLSRFVEHSFSKSTAVAVLENFKEVLVNFRRRPFRMRRVSIDSVTGTAQSSMPKMTLFFRELLDALSLKSEMDSDGKLIICLAGDPIKTSLALPVAMDALGYMISVLITCDNFDKNMLSLPLSKLNRLHSGCVLASGEELPFGTAVSAFDGIQLSKWEEPSGAKGSWIIYRVSNDQMHELKAYEIMSANDAPERDPMDWVVEGSKDAGSSWQSLDKQVSQMFENRFQRKLYIINSEGVLSNMFRFRFLAVRDVQATSRLQIGSIDLYIRDRLRN